ncbi:MAG: NADH-quinone oxidoreductase subunit A [Bacteroidota bacterium]
MLTDFGRVLAFLLVAILFVAVVMFVARLLRPHRPSRDKLRTYECGEEPVGEPWVKFNIRFYVVALIFVIFDVEVVFLFPWATVFAQLGWFAFIEMMVFIGMLLVGLAYVWAKGDLEWDKPQPQIPRLQSARGGQPAEKSLVGEQEEVTV